MTTARCSAPGGPCTTVNCALAQAHALRRLQGAPTSARRRQCRPAGAAATTRSGATLPIPGLRHARGLPRLSAPRGFRNSEPRGRIVASGWVLHHFVCPPKHITADVSLDAAAQVPVADDKVKRTWTSTATIRDGDIAGYWGDNNEGTLPLAAPAQCRPPLRAGPPTPPCGACRGAASFPRCQASSPSALDHRFRAPSAGILPQELKMDPGTARKNRLASNKTNIRTDGSISAPTPLLFPVRHPRLFRTPRRL